jgi:hypothetical protein
VTNQDLAEMFGEIGQITREFVLRELDKATKPLLDRIAELERRPTLKYAGVWREGKAYPVGALVTRSGGLWLSTEDTAGNPGRRRERLEIDR